MRRVISDDTIHLQGAGDEECGAKVPIAPSPIIFLPIAQVWLVFVGKNIVFIHSLVNVGVFVQGFVLATPQDIFPL